MKRHIEPGPDDLPPALFKDGGASLVRQPVMFSNVWFNEEVTSSCGE